VEKNQNPFNFTLSSFEPSFSEKVMTTNKKYGHLVQGEFFERCAATMAPLEN
jgi:hypothetical protein